MLTSLLLFYAPNLSIVSVLCCAASLTLSSTLALLSSTCVNSQTCRIWSVVGSTAILSDEILDEAEMIEH